MCVLSKQGSHSLHGHEWHHACGTGRPVPSAGGMNVVTPGCVYTDLRFAYGRLASKVRTRRWRFLDAWIKHNCSACSSESRFVDAALNAPVMGAYLHEQSCTLSQYTLNGEFLSGYRVLLAEQGMSRRLHALAAEWVAFICRQLGEAVTETYTPESFRGRGMYREGVGAHGSAANSVCTMWHCIFTVSCHLGLRPALRASRYSTASPG